MRWSDIKKSKQSNIKNGTIRSRKGFLFLPKKIGHITRWLEYAKWSEQFIWYRQRWNSVLNDFYSVDYFKWDTIQWDD